MRRISGKAKFCAISSSSVGGSVGDLVIPDDVVVVNTVSDGGLVVGGAAVSDVTTMVATVVTVSVTSEVVVGIVVIVISAGAQDAVKIASNTTGDRVAHNLVLIDILQNLFI